MYNILQAYKFMLKMVVSQKIVHVFKGGGYQKDLPSPTNQGKQKFHYGISIMNLAL